MTTTTDAPDLITAEPAARPPGAFTVLMRTRPELVLAPVLLVVILAAWEWGVPYFEVPNYVLPTPSAIVTALWRGLGLTSKVVIICLLTFFPLLVNSMAGFKAVDPERLELMRALGANPWQIFWKVRLPSALPYIFAGLDMAAVFAVVGAIVGEFVGAQRGLGTLILSMNAQMDIAGTFSVFIILSLVGVLLHQGLRALERRLLFWSGEEMRMTGS
jgi:NitT/TauT family transport system permease protein